MALLSGVRIIDVTDGMAGPMATQVMADYGADIVRVDLPGARREPWQLVRLRGRRSIAVDLAQEDGRTLVTRLVAGADVLLLEQGLDGRYRFEADYAALSQLNPRLVLCRISGHGEDGPLAGTWAHDHLVAARYGVHNQPGYREGPTYLTAYVPSLGAGLLAVQGIGAALWLRERDGHGQEVDTSLLAGALAFQPGIVSATNDGGAPQQAYFGRGPRGVLPFYSVYECADGAWLHLGCLSRQFQDRAIQTLGLETEMARLGFGTARQQETQPRMVEAVEKLLLTKPYAAWAAILEAADIPYAPSQWTEDLLDDPQVLHANLRADFDDPTVGALQQMGAVATTESDAWSQPAPAPSAGQHTDAICEELGLTSEGIARLRREGVIA